MLSQFLLNSSQIRAGIKLEINIRRFSKKISKLWYQQVCILPFYGVKLYSITPLITLQSIRRVHNNCFGQCNSSIASGHVHYTAIMQTFITQSMFLLVLFTSVHIHPIVVIREMITNPPSCCVGKTSTIQQPLTSNFQNVARKPDCSI